TITLFAAELGASSFNIGILTATYTLLPLLLALPIGRLVDKVGTKTPLIISFGGFSTGIFLPFIFSNISALYLSQIISGAFHLCIVVLLQNTMGHFASKSRSDYYFTLYTIINGIGTSLGPLVGGYISDIFNYAIVFLMAIIIGLFSILVTFSIKPRYFAKKGRTSTGSQKNEQYKLPQLLKIPTLRNAVISSSVISYSRD